MPEPLPEGGADEVARQLRRAEARLDAVRRALSHDTRAPLAVILGQCELLGQGLGGALSDRQRRGIDAIRRQTERLGDLLDGLLDDVLADGISRGATGATEGEEP